jgi:phospholipid transport system substrate-binding protein
MRPSCFSIRPEPHGVFARRSALGAILTLGLAFWSLAAQPGHAAADPAATRIETFHALLLETMKQGPSLGARGRFDRLEPAVREAFDLPFMTRVAVGPKWSTFTAAEQDSLVKAFTRLTAASYAHNFDRYAGERFELSPTVETRGPDKIVQARLIPSGAAPVALSYRMRADSVGAWKIVDVYYGAISQLATRRSDFTAPLNSGGAAGLVSHLDALSRSLLK